MEDLQLSNMSASEIELMEGFLNKSFSNLQPKASFQATLKDRLTASNVFSRRNRLGASWVLGLSVALAGFTFYGICYLIYKSYVSKS